MEMEIRFAGALQDIKELAKKQGGVIEEEQINGAFEAIGFKLDEEKKPLVYDYLKKSGIGIGEAADPEDYMSGEEADYLKRYLEETEQLAKLTEGEKEAVTLSAMAGDRDAQNKLIEIYLPYVAQIAKLYAGQGVYLEDLIGEGNVALAMGAGMLGCLEKPSEAQGMLGRMMMEAMEAYIRVNVDASRIYRKLVEKVNYIAEAARELAADLGRKVTPNELAEEKGISVKSILDAVRISGDKIEDIGSTVSNGTEY